MRALRCGCALVIAANWAAAQEATPARYRIVEVQTSEKLAGAANEAARQHYRKVLSYGATMLMEYSGGTETYKYVVTTELANHPLHEELNTAGARGYRVADGVGRALFPAQHLLMEKAPGRPNQYQYVLENGHHLAMGKAGLPKDEFTQAPELLAGRARAGYLPRAQFGALTVLEKAAEPTGEDAPCVQAGCYGMRVVNAHKNLAGALSEEGGKGLRFVAAAMWAGWSTSDVLALLVRDGAAVSYEYRTVPARHAKAPEPLLAAAEEGFCVRAQVLDVLLLERSPGSRRCEYRLVTGIGRAIEKDVEAAANDGFLPVLMNGEAHGFNKRTVTFTVIMERIAGGANK